MAGGGVEKVKNDGRWERDEERKGINQLAAVYSEGKPQRRSPAHPTPAPGHRSPRSVVRIVTLPTRNSAANNLEHENVFHFDRRSGNRIPHPSIHVLSYLPSPIFTGSMHLHASGMGVSELPSDSYQVVEGGGSQVSSYETLPVS